MTTKDTKDTADLAAAIGRLNDLEEIRSLVFAYRTHVDERDMKSFAALFADNGEWIGGRGRATGPAAIQDMLEARLDPNPPAPGPTMHHVVSNLVIDIDPGGDRATGHSIWDLVGRGPGDTPVHLRSGHYDDVYVKQDGSWRFRRRVARSDIPDVDLGEYPASDQVR